MAETAIVFTPKYYRHNTGPGHPETAKRLKVIMKELESLNLFSTGNKCKLVKPDLASIRDLELAHTAEHIHLVQRTCEHGGGLLDLGDTVVSPESFEVARYAVGGAIKGVDLVLNGKFRNAFALIRPPGHHAGPYYGMGFCVFNNVAIAASYLTGRLGLARVLILDIDAHHGNGTQDIFYSTRKVLYVSLHEDPQGFPGTGFVDEVGEGEGLGYNVNIPLPFRVGDEAYLRAVDDVVVPIVRQYSPQFILVSVGYDGYCGDPVAKLSLSASSYSRIFRKILDLASNLCEDRFVAVLEGGYNLRQLGKLVASTIAEMAGFPYRMQHENSPASLEAEKQAENIIEKSKRIQSAFWSLQS